MKTLGELTKCRDKKAKIRRKCGLIFGHLRQFDTAFARNCRFQTGITSDYGLRETLRRAATVGSASAHLQDSYLRRMLRLTNTLARVGQGMLHKKDVRKRRAKPLCVRKQRKQGQSARRKNGHFCTNDTRMTAFSRRMARDDIPWRCRD